MLDVLSDYVQEELEYRGYTVVMINGWDEVSRDEMDTEMSYSQLYRMMGVGSVVFMGGTQFINGGFVYFDVGLCFKDGCLVVDYEVGIPISGFIEDNISQRININISSPDCDVRKGLHDFVVLFNETHVNFLKRIRSKYYNDTLFNKDLFDAIVERLKNGL